MNNNDLSINLTTPKKTCDTAVTGHGVASGLEIGHRTCTCGTCDRDTAVSPVPVLHPMYYIY